MRFNWITYLVRKVLLLRGGRGRKLEHLEKSRSREQGSFPEKCVDVSRDDTRSDGEVGGISSRTPFFTKQNAEASNPGKMSQSPIVLEDKSGLRSPKLQHLKRSPLNHWFLTNVGIIFFQIWSNIPYLYG